ncbi:MAG: hypothetical protein AUI14_22395 [Actinobacteria bacterium 13_2_20CM_2_71_6]|nr:MAG: hypothetical protein AUI14_22395 [Actinobacteria bacterium 13_2_20CM_2_71_6]
MPEADVVQVVFVDAADGAVFGRSDLPAAQLPDSFEVATTLQIGDATWSVERAEPPSAAQFRARGTLRLTLRKVELVSPRDILYSLPTICDALPSLDGTAGDHAGYDMHEDDWRQVEMVDAGLANVVGAQLHAVRAIYEEHVRRADDGRLIGFTSIHVRTQPADPLPGSVSWRRLSSLLPPPDATVGFGGRAGGVPGSFAVAVGPVVLYGIAHDDAVRVLGLRLEPTPPREGGPDPVACLREVMRSFNVVLVDWCRCAMVGPDTVGEYLAAVGPA